MKIALILNPHSGGSQRRPWLAGAVTDFMRQRQIDARLWLTEGPGHATVLAKQALEQGCDRIVAIGGDGTMHEVACPMIGTAATLGMIPCGSGNGLGRHLGLHRSVRWVLELVTNPQARTLAIDTGTVNGRPFCNVMGLGFDAEIGHRFNQLERRGVLAYAGVTLASLRQMHPLRCTLSSDGRRETIEALMVTVANSAQYGNHALIAPGADVTDGKLDLVVIRPVSILHAIALLPRLFLGTLPGSPRVLHRQVERIVIERAGPGLIHTDGETMFEGPRLEVAVRPASLHLIIPPATPAPARAAMAPGPLQHRPPPPHRPSPA